ncbi:MAG: LIC_10190 family membrane protein [Chitinophagaceae bacterium]
MLSLFLLHIIITGTCLCAGFLFYESVPQKKYENNEYKPLAIYLISGLICLTIFFQLLVLFFPINIVSQLVSVLLLAMLALSRKKAFSKFILHVVTEIKKQSMLLFIATCSIWILLLVLNAGKTMMDDTESYHIQMVKWVKEYGTVPGIVHLHQRFGFNSSWFTSIAIFNPQSGTLNYYTALNGVLSLWLSVYLLAMIATRQTSRQLLSMAATVVLAVCIISWPLLRGNASTSNYDFITMLVIFILFTETLKSTFPVNKLPFLPEWIIWPAYLFTIRITNFPLLLLSVIAFIFLWREKERTKLFFYCSASVLLVIPFLARNTILSGYPFYPSMYFDWTTVDWKANKEKTVELLRYIKYYNRVSTGFLPLETTAAMNFSQWTRAWITYMFTYDKIIFIPGISGLILEFFLSGRRNSRYSLATRIFILIMSLQLAVWFVVAPDPRFIYGCLLCGVLLLSLRLFSLLKIRKELTRYSSTISLLAIAVTISAFTISKVTRGSEHINLVIPGRLPQPPVQTIAVDKIRVHIPEKIMNNWNPRCYATQLPCAYNIDPRVRARGTTIKAGFRLDK